MKNKKLFQEMVDRRLESMDIQELLMKQGRVTEIMNHPLFIAPPQSVEDSYRFGWMRGIALMTDTMLEGRWYNWLAINAKGEFDPDNIPNTRVTKDSSANSIGRKMLDKCMEIISPLGYRVTDFIEWIGYGLGIAWFKKPKLPENLWTELYQTFNLDIFFMEPADYLSNFVSVHGQSGHLDYYPTPMHVTTLINQLLNEDDNARTNSQFEPCIGGAAMLLPSNSLNLIGADLSLTMVQVSSIQAFIYMPWMLYVPKPIVGLHVDPVTLTINKYFEFDTDTRIYYGNSLLGEYQAPIHIFEKDSVWVDVNCHPLDLSKREIFKYEEDMLEPWESIPHERKVEIVKAQSREIGWDRAATNPPFNAKLGKSSQEEMRSIEKRNIVFLEERKKRIDEYNQTSFVVEQIIEEVNIKISENKSKKIAEGQFEMVF